MARRQIRVSSRFYRLLQRGEGCWEWRGARTDGGYGVMSVGRRTVGAHRVSWLLHRGPLEEHERVTHLCGNRACVRPDHLATRSGSRAAVVPAELDGLRRIP